MCGCRTVLAVTATTNNIREWEEHHVRGRGGEGERRGTIIKVDMVMMV